MPHGKAASPHALRIRLVDGAAGPRLGALRAERVVGRALSDRGFLATWLLSLMLVALLLFLTVFLAAAFAGRKKAVETYQWFGAAMEFAAQAANVTGDLALVELETARARRYFEIAFAEMTGTRCAGRTFDGGPYPGPITLVSFESVGPGDAVPGGVARQPGFVATLEVPVLGTNLPFLGRQYVAVPMRYFAVVRSQQIQI